MKLQTECTMVDSNPLSPFPTAYSNLDCLKPNVTVPRRRVWIADLQDGGLNQAGRQEAALPGTAR